MPYRGEVRFRVLLVAALVLGLASTSARGTAPPASCSRLIAHGDTTPLVANELTALFSLDPEAFRRQACQNPRRLFASMREWMKQPTALAALVGIPAGALNFAWYHSTLLYRLPTELAAVNGSVTPRRVESEGPWTAALEAASLQRGSQRDMGRYLSRLGRHRGPPAPLENPWSELHAEAWFDHRALPVHWGPVFAQVRAIREHDADTDFSDQAWFLQTGRRGALMALYGALTEGWLYSNAPNRVPGAAIRVGGQAHADFWDVAFKKDGTVVVTGLGEIKSSAQGYANSGRQQIRRFLDAMTRPASDIVVYGQPIDPSQLRFRGSGGALLDAAAVRKALALDRWNGETRPASHDGVMPQDAHDGHWEDEFVWGFRRTFATTFYRMILPSDEARLVEANRKLLGSTVGVIEPGRLARDEIRDLFARFVVQTFSDRAVRRRTIDELVFADEDTARRIALHLDVGTRRPPPGRKLPVVQPLPPLPPALADERFASRDYDAVYEATLAILPDWASFANGKHGDVREALRVVLKKLGFRTLFRPDGRPRTVTIDGSEVRIAAEGRAAAFVLRFRSDLVRPTLRVDEHGVAILELAPGADGRRLLEGQDDPFWDAGLVGHDLQRYSSGAGLRQERLALGEPAIAPKPGQLAEENGFVAEASLLGADAAPLRRFVLAPPAYGKTIMLARSIARLAAMPRAAPGRGIVLAVTAKEPVLDQIADELSEQLPRDGKLRLVPRSARRHVPTLVESSKEGDVVVPILWRELVAIRKDPAAWELLRGALRGVFVDEAQELADKPDVLDTFEALIAGQTGIAVVGYSASALREAIVKKTGPFGGRVFAVYPELLDRGLTHAILDAQNRAMRDGMITPLRADKDGKVVTYFHPRQVVASLEEADLFAQYRFLRGSDPDAGEIARVRAEAEEAMVGSLKYPSLSDEGRAVAWLAVARLLHETILTRERGFFRFNRADQARDFLKTLNEYNRVHGLNLRFAEYLDGTPNKSEVLAGMRSEDPATRIDWVVTCRLMDVGVDATPLSTAVSFTQDSDPELFAQIGGRPMRLHAGKRFAQWWHIAREPVGREELLEALGKKAEAIERVRVEARPVALSLGAAVQGPTEPMVALPEVAPVAPATFAIPDGALSDVEADRYRRLVAAHQRVLFDTAGIEATELADLLDYVRLVSALQVTLKAFEGVRNRGEEALSDWERAVAFTRDEAKVILEGRRSRGAYDGTPNEVFAGLLESVGQWDRQDSPSWAVGWFAMLALLDTSMLDEVLDRLGSDLEWPVRLRSRASMVTRTQNMEVGREPEADLDTRLARLDALALPGEWPTEKGARLRAYLRLRAENFSRYANSDDDALLAEIDRIECAVNGTESIWRARDRSFHRFSPAIVGTLRWNYLKTVARAARNQAFGLFSYTEEPVAQTVGVVGVDRKMMESWLARLDRIHQPNRRAATLEATTAAYQQFLVDVRGPLRNHLHHLQCVRGWNRFDLPLPPWDRARATVEEWLAQTTPGTLKPTFRYFPAKPFEAVADPTLAFTFPPPAETEVLTEDELRGEVSWDLYERAVLDWLLSDAVLVAWEETLTQLHYAPPSEKRYDAVKQFVRFAARVKALYRRLPADRKQAILDGDEAATLTFVDRSTVDEGIAALSAGLPYPPTPTTDPSRPPPIEKQAAALKLLGGKLPTTDVMVALMPQASLERLRALVRQEKSDFDAAEQKFARDGDRVGVLYAAQRMTALSVGRLFVAMGSNRSRDYQMLLAFLDSEIARRKKPSAAVVAPPPAPAPPLVWNRPPRPRGVKSTDAETRVWAHVTALARGWEAERVPGQDAEANGLNGARIALAFYDLRYRFENIQGNPSTVERQRLALLDEFRDVWTSLHSTPLPDYHRSPEKLDDRTQHFLGLTDGIRLSQGIALYQWSIAAHRALHEGKTPEDPPTKVAYSGVPELTLPLPAATARESFEALREAKMLRESAIYPDDLVRFAEALPSRMSSLVMRLRQRHRRLQLKKPSDAAGLEAILTETREVLRAARLAFALRSVDVWETTLTGPLDEDVALRWAISAVDWLGSKLYARIPSSDDETDPIAALEESFGAYNGLLAWELKAIKAQYASAMARALRDNRIDSPKVRSVWSVVLGPTRTHLTALGGLHARLANAEHRESILKKIAAGELTPLDGVPVLRSAVPAGKIIEGEALEQLPPLPELPVLAATRGGATSVDDWLREYLRWAMAPRRLLWKERLRQCNESRPLWECVPELSAQVYGEERDVVADLMQRLPSDLDTARLGIAREVFFERHTEYLEQLRSVALRDRDSSRRAESRESEMAVVSFRNPMQHRPLHERLRAVEPETLRFVLTLVENVEAELDAIGRAQNFEWRKNRRWIESFFAASEIGVYLRLLAGSKEPELPRTFEEARALVEKALEAPLGARAFDPPPLRFEGELRKTADSRSQGGLVLRTLEQAWARAFADGASDKDRAEWRLRFLALAVPGLRTLRRAAGVDPRVLVKLVDAMLLTVPPGHPWKEHLEQVRLKITVGIDDSALTLPFTLLDAYLAGSGDTAMKQLLAGGSLDELAAPLSIPVTGGEVEKLPMDEARATVVLAELNQWFHLELDEKMDWRDRYLFVLEYARKKTAAFNVAIAGLKRQITRGKSFDDFETFIEEAKLEEARLFKMWRLLLPSDSVIAELDAGRLQIGFLGASVEGIVGRLERAYPKGAEPILDYGRGEASARRHLMAERDDTEGQRRKQLLVEAAEWAKEKWNDQQPIPDPLPEAVEITRSWIERDEAQPFLPVDWNLKFRHVLATILSVKKELDTIIAEGPTAKDFEPTGIRLPPVDGQPWVGRPSPFDPVAYGRRIAAEVLKDRPEQPDDEAFVLALERWSRRSIALTLFATRHLRRDLSEIQRRQLLVVELAREGAELTNRIMPLCPPHSARLNRTAQALKEMFRPLLERLQGAEVYVTDQRDDGVYMDAAFASELKSAVVAKLFPDAAKTGIRWLTDDQIADFRRLVDYGAEVEKRFTAPHPLLEPADALPLLEIYLSREVGTSPDSNKDLRNRVTFLLGEFGSRPVHASLLERVDAEVRRRQPPP